MSALQRKLFFAILFTLIGAAQAFGNVLDGKKTVYLVRADNTELPIGTVVFSPNAKGIGATVKLESNKFADHFLSMRPFRCITEETQAVCHLPYPYKLKNRVSAEDMRYLEYQFLFISRHTKEYGINFWNGLYYRLKLQVDGSLLGTLMETDFNELASPPKKEFSFPFADSELTEIPPGQHRFPQIRIR